MSIQAFLYRRLARFVTCELQLPSGRKLSLKTKYDVASASDVFCHPFYWQLLSLLDHPPVLVVDCGANCGHFSILAEECIRIRFNQTTTRYLLVEPNPLVLPILKSNLDHAGIWDRSQVHQGLLGQGDTQEASLQVSSSNYLSASLSPTVNGRSFSIPCLRLADLIDNPIIDILKVDIEGGEFGLVKEEPEILQKARILLMELHGVNGQRQAEFLSALCKLGFSVAVGPLVHGEHRLLAMKNGGVITGSERVNASSA